MRAAQSVSISNACGVPLLQLVNASGLGESLEREVLQCLEKDVAAVGGPLHERALDERDEHRVVVESSDADAAGARERPGKDTERVERALHLLVEQVVRPRDRG